MATINPSPSPQKNQISGGINIAGLKTQVMQGIQQRGLNPAVVVQIGQMSEHALKDKGLFPMVKQAAIKSGLLSERDFGPGFNPKILAALAAAGKVASNVR